MKKRIMVLVSFGFCFFCKGQNLGVGTLQPLMKLHVSSAGDSVLLLENTSPAGTGISTGLYFKNSPALWTGAIKTTGQTSSAARLGFFTQTSANATGLIERLSILNNGNIGIGTINPDSNLTVAGSVHFTGNTLIAGNPSLKLEVSGTTKTNNFQLTSGAGANKILVSDANGNASWTGCGLSIGQNYQGGIIFYLDAMGCHGLIAAPADQSPGMQWYNSSYTNTTAFSNGTGMGQGNTKLIRFNQGAGTYAAQLCADLNSGGYTDWYLPSKFELNLMYMNIGPGASSPNNNAGGFTNSYYWSSTEVDSDHAWCQLFLLGAQISNTKNNNYRVRAIRAF